MDMANNRTEKALLKVMAAVKAKTFGYLEHSANERTGNIILTFIGLDKSVIAKTSIAQVVGKRYPRRKK